MDRRPNKRPTLRLTGDIPQASKGRSSGISRGQDVDNASSFRNSRVAPDHGNPYVNGGGAQRRPPSWRREDNNEGRYVFELGQDLTSQYKITSTIGEGTFGQVVGCWDREAAETVAIKIGRSTKIYRDAAMVEIGVLQLLGRYDLNGSRFVRLRNWFEYRNHVCLVLEKLGPSLFDFLRKNSYGSLPVDLVRDIGRQLLQCAAFMHDLRLIHTDLKPENVLFVSSPGALSQASRKLIPIKVIDFGNAVYEHQDRNYIVTTRPYRAPEVILGLGWSYPCDMWSIGCILAEMCSGAVVFRTHDDLKHLAMMERVLGRIPQRMLEAVDENSVNFVRKGRLVWPEGVNSSESMKAVMELPRLPNLVMQHADHSAGDLIRLLQGLLKFEPSERLTAREALRHPFFTGDHANTGGTNISLAVSSQQQQPTHYIQRSTWSLTGQIYAV